MKCSSAKSPWSGEQCLENSCSSPFSGFELPILRHGNSKLKVKLPALDQNWGAWLFSVSKRTAQSRASEIIPSGVQRSFPVNSREVTTWLYTSTRTTGLPVPDPTVSSDTMLPNWMEFTQGNWKYTSLMEQSQR